MQHPQVVSLPSIHNVQPYQQVSQYSKTTSGGSQRKQSILNNRKGGDPPMAIPVALTAAFLEEEEAHHHGDGVVETASGVGRYHHNPYGHKVLASREYPTPSYTNSAVTKKKEEEEEKQIETNNESKSSPEGPQHEHAMYQHHPYRVSVAFKRESDTFRVEPNDARGGDGGRVLQVGDYVLVEGDRGQDIGYVTKVFFNDTRHSSRQAASYASNVVRRASEEDKEKLKSMREEEALAASLCRQRVSEYQLKMKIEDVEFQFDGGKITVYYSSKGPVDFRQLQRQLFRDFRCRVWLRTIWTDE
eukprot:PhF_6_TR33000/c0_g1_i1/m.48624